MGPTLDAVSVNSEPLYIRDPYLKIVETEIERRNKKFLATLNRIVKEHGSLQTFSSSYERYGCHCQADSTFCCIQWIPNAKNVWLTGDFNNWNSTQFPFTSVGQLGLWQITLSPNSDGSCRVPHLSRIKIVIEAKDGNMLHRIDPWASYVCSKGAEESYLYQHHFWNPPADQIYKFVNPNPTERPKSLRIYECHVGISSFEGKVNSYADFTDHVLPRIARLGYNAVQVMAIMEHAYYASFGYQVTSFFAPSSRYGTPEDLKRLVDVAHGLGLYVLLDLVHSHASNNVDDGLNMFDGTDHYLFHGGCKGCHSLWDSRLFNYGHTETLRFLLGNVHMWLDVFCVDGFRFDGVTSMLYHSHGIGHGFSGDYHEYFGPNTDAESVVYLKLVNCLIKSVRPQAIVIAEDVSGMPTLCRPISEGGFGFDFRLAMAIPDMWIKMLKEQKDEEWNMGNVVHTLSNRRWGEPVVAYAESHDQALVGDKTLAFWLMDKAMYTEMTVTEPRSVVVERGLALHKMIRLLVHGLGGEAYLNFIGNEFGHPEWLDFPRAGNNNSFHYARRQFHLADDDNLCYKFLNAFDAQMNSLEGKYGWLSADPGHVSVKHEDDKIISFDRAGCVFVFNFHVSSSFCDYSVGVKHPGLYRVVFDSDQTDFGGPGDRICHKTDHFSCDTPVGGLGHSVQLYVPSRTVQILVRLD